MLRHLGLAAVALVLLAETLLTRQQIKVWENAETLWGHQLYYQPKLILAWANLGTYFHRNHRYTEAMGYDLMAIYYGHRPGRRAPYEYATVCGAHYNLTSLLWYAHRVKEAEASWNDAVRSGCLGILKPGPRPLE